MISRWSPCTNRGFTISTVLYIYSTSLVRALCSCLSWWRRLYFSPRRASATHVEQALSAAGGYHGFGVLSAEGTWSELEKICVVTVEFINIIFHSMTSCLIVAVHCLILTATTIRINGSYYMYIVG